MKQFFLLITASFISIITISQNAFKKGDKLVTLGVGINSDGIPVGASFEYGISDNISVGPHVYYWSNKDYGFQESILDIAARLCYHFDVNSDKLDIYGLAALGYQRVSVKYETWYDYVEAKGSDISFDIGIGGKYYFSKNIGAFAELGYGIAYLKAGVAFKF